MITVEFNADREEVGLFFDKDGGTLLVELLQDLLNNGERDTIRLQALVESSGRFKRQPEDHALSVEKINPRPGWKVTDMMALLYRPSEDDLLKK